MKAKTITRATIGIAVLGLLASMPVRAQEGGFEIGVGGGLTVLDDKLGGDTGLSLELRAGYFVTDRFELEIQGSHVSSILDGAFTSYTVNAVYHLRDTEGPVSYLLVGAGIADVELDSLSTVSPEDEVTVLRAGLGGRYWLGEMQRASIRVELSALNEDSFDESSTHLGFTGTFSWRFGG